jgi:hypothetical protein
MKCLTLRVFLFFVGVDARKVIKFLRLCIGRKTAPWHYDNDEEFPAQELSSLGFVDLHLFRPTPLRGRSPKPPSSQKKFISSEA